MQTRQEISIFRIKSEIIPYSGGLRKFIVLGLKQLTADVCLVGQDTYWKAQAANIILKFSIKIRRLFFDNEKFCYFNHQLYEIINLGKTADANEILLNVAEYNNDEIISAFKEAHCG